jgi:hypothetical protein
MASLPCIIVIIVIVIIIIIISGCLLLLLLLIFVINIGNTSIMDPIFVARVVAT